MKFKPGQNIYIAPLGRRFFEEMLKDSEIRFSGQVRSATHFLLETEKIVVGYNVNYYISGMLICGYNAVDVGTHEEIKSKEINFEYSCVIFHTREEALNFLSKQDFFINSNEYKFYKELFTGEKIK